MRIAILYRKRTYWCSRNCSIPKKNFSVLHWASDYYNHCIDQYLYRNQYSTSRMDTKWVQLPKYLERICVSFEIGIDRRPRFQGSHFIYFNQENRSCQSHLIVRNNLRGVSLVFLWNLEWKMDSSRLCLCNHWIHRVCLGIHVLQNEIHPISSGLSRRIQSYHVMFFWSTALWWNFLFSDFKNWPYGVESILFLNVQRIVSIHSNTSMCSAFVENKIVWLHIKKISMKVLIKEYPNTRVYSLVLWLFVLALLIWNRDKLWFSKKENLT